MKRILTALSMAAIITACGQDNSASQNSSIQPSITNSKRPVVEPETFKMFSDPQHRLTGCDIFTSLQLRNTVEGAEAILRDGVLGMCEIHVPENKRVFKLKASADRCGSKLYFGENIDPETAAVTSLSVADHKLRTCRDLQPARIIMNERNEKFSITKYSLDNIIEKQAEVTGKIVTVMAIGGETTGYAISTESGLVEVSFTNKELLIDARAHLAAERIVSVKGTFKEVLGVEIPVRQILVAESIAAL